MAKHSVKLIPESKDVVGEILLVENGETKLIDLRLLDERQKKHFYQAYADFLRNINCWDYFSSYVLPCGESESSPLSRALTELWLVLAVNQGEMASSNDLTVYIYIRI